MAPVKNAKRSFHIQAQKRGNGLPRHATQPHPCTRTQKAKRTLHPHQQQRLTAGAMLNHAFPHG